MVETSAPPSGGGDGVEIVSLRDALEERYLAYALSTIMHRALPDARDGLKPVHRRLLHAMRLLKLDPGSAFKKCARVVGDVIGKFHPHGDQAVYDAMVRLAQDFAQRYPLVEGQGNFGNIDGDNPAAYRYTEARLTAIAQLLLRGIDEDAVEFRATYNGEDEEPVVLPGAFPNLLANGSQGIAVGMATSIPPHNAAELCEAALYLIDHPATDSAGLMSFVPGPDFPTGGVIVETPAAMAEAYRSGRGGFRVRARWAREEAPRGGWVVVVTEIPYLVQKSRLIEKIAELLELKKLPLLADIRDESAEDVRIVLEPKSRAIDPVLMMEGLFRLTELESRIPLNMNVLVDGQRPQVIGLAEALRIWLDHRRVVLGRRSRFRLGQIERRLEILGGLLIVYLDLDEVIRIIREVDEPKSALMARFGINDVQANAILDTRLRSLRKLEEMELRREFDALTAESEEIGVLLASDKAQWRRIGKEIRADLKLFGRETALGRRRTSFAVAPDTTESALHAALVEREPITVVVSKKGWIRALKGHGLDLSTLSFKGDDALALAFPTDTTAKLLVLAANGKVFTLEAAKLPGGRGLGDPIRLMADIDEGAGIVTVFPYVAGVRYVIANDVDRGFVVAADELVANTRKGKQVLTLDQGETARFVVPVEGDHVAVVGQNRKIVVFPLAALPEMARGKGVRLQRYKDASLSDIRTFILSKGLSWRTSDGRTQTLTRPQLDEYLGARGDAGRAAPRHFPKSNCFTG